jgi:hypothetical protein
MGTIMFSGSRRYPSFGGAINPGSFKAQDAVIDDNTFRFAAVTGTNCETANTLFVTILQLA